MYLGGRDKQIPESTTTLRIIYHRQDCVSLSGKSPLANQDATPCICSLELQVNTGLGGWLSLQNENV